MKLKNFWLIAEILGVLGLAQRYKKNTEEWVSIQTARMWLKSVSFTRDLAIYQVGISACAMVLVLSAILMEVALVFCIPTSLKIKMIVIFAVGGADFAVALCFLGHFLSSERWLKKAAQYNTCLAALLRSEDPFQQGKK